MTESHTLSQPPDEAIASSSAPVESHAQPSSRDESDERESIELTEIETHEDDWGVLSPASLSSGEEYHITTRSRSQVSQQVASGEEIEGIGGSVRRFWTRHVVLNVPEKSNRDHFALERTFLAYVRTSVTLAMQGVLIAQLFRLQRRPDARGVKIGFYEVGIPLSAACHGVAILVALIGAHRFWKQQTAVSQGRVYAGGWELNAMGLLVVMVNITIFILSAVITAELGRSF